VVKAPLSLYFHIPFCKRKCPYCHFYVIPEREDQKEQLLASLLLEWQTLLPKVKTHEIVSIYFGGGTPSLFGSNSIGKLLEIIKAEAKVSSDCEITLEANPEDLTPTMMKGYRDVGINRVSIGIQSLVNSSLEILERTHSAQKALSAIEDTYLSGIENISIDLMYELPDQTLESFQKTLNQIQSLPISHLSLYNLTIEPHTAFSKRKLHLPLEEEGLKMLQTAVSHLESIGLVRYEISAFATPGFESRHNLGYWTARPFFGLGPSAFSYYEGSRFRNVAHLHRYSKALSEGRSPVDFSETLSYPKNIQELLAVRLRLIEGAPLDLFELPIKTKQTIQELIEKGYLEPSENRIRLTAQGLLFYDTVASEII